VRDLENEGDVTSKRREAVADPHGPKTRKTCLFKRNMAVACCLFLVLLKINKILPDYFVF
jgi:hypothetical protein